MRKLTIFRTFSLLVALSVSFFVEAVSGIYAGGPVYNGRGYSIGELKSSGFTHVIVWTIHIENDGSLGFNGEFPLVQNGDYIGANSYPNFQSDIASLKTGGTSVTRVEFGLSAAGSGTYANVRSLLECSQSHCGTGPNSILYRNFQVLRDTFPSVDALNNDDESTYHVQTAAPFHIMLADIGFKTAIVPYRQKSFWQAFVNQVNTARPGSVDALYLQAYAGGSGNNPCNWDLGLPVYPGLWSRDDSPSQVRTQMQNWENSCGITGGFMWLYDDFDNTPQVGQYAAAINDVFGGSPPSGVASVHQHCPYLGYEIQLQAGSYTTGQLQALGAVDNDISSIKVDPGYEVTVFQNDNFAGFSWRLSGDDSCINNNTEGRTDGNDWNDDISSIIVAPVDTSGSVLQKGVVKSGLSGGAGVELRYTFEVPSGVSGIAITMSAGSGDADLYVNHNSQPTVAAAANNDCRPYSGGNNETCTTQLSPYSGGTYHVMVHGYRAFSGVSLVADYTE